MADEHTFWRGDILRYCSTDEQESDENGAEPHIDHPAGQCESSRDA